MYVQFSATTGEGFWRFENEKFARVDEIVHPSVSIGGKF